MKKYENPILEVKTLSLEDVINSSQGSDDHIYNPGDEGDSGTDLT